MYRLIFCNQEISGIFLIESHETKTGAMLKLIRTKGHFGRCPLQKNDAKNLSDFEQEIVSFTLVQIFLFSLFFLNWWKKLRVF